ncbi:hypothetical protein B0A53_00867 [Rhodotorula sp. CCFEE 5036]|nr:hypothetical protein B0A53_00867 [Rhodotorula sp. CCFEE 5036]
MHAASAAVRARARSPVLKWIPPWLLNRPPIRPFSIGSPLYGDGQAKAAQAITTKPLATRLKQKRSADIQSPSSHDHAASPSSAGSSRATPTTAKASDQSHKGPHKIRVPATAKGDQAAGEARKDRKRAPIEGFKAKRFAMQRLRREQAQAVAEAHDGDWLADEHKNPYELGAERYMRTQGHLPIKDQLRLYRARLSLLESLRQPWDKLGRQERQFEVVEYAKTVRAREKRRKGGESNADASQSGGAAVQATDAPAEDTASTSTVQKPGDFDEMVRTHSEAVEGEPPVNAESAAASGPNDLAKPNKKKKKNKPDKEIAAEREQTWPAEMERMDLAIKQFRDRIAELTSEQSRDGTAPAPPPLRPRTGPSLLDQIAEAVSSSASAEPRTRGRTPRGQAARTAADGGIDYENHPALSQRDAEPAPPARELSSYQHVLSPASTPFVAHPSPYQVPVATLAHSLDRVLFNPGVHFLRDPRSGVYNFTRDTLENVPKISEFDFSKLPQYVTSSKDETLKEIAANQGKIFSGSTSSTVGMLCQIYFWLSKGKQNRDFSMGQKLPVSVVLRYEDGRYAIDADKSFDPTNGSNVLADYGHLMEKLLTTEAGEFKRFLHGAEDPAPSEADHRQAYHYSLTDRMVLRSQLDATNDHLPNKTFDLKTRGTVAIRQDRLNYEESSGYTIDRLQGEWESFEREYYDLIRSAFLKYQFQARIGGMDGIFVAYHSTARFFGFQYLPVSVMDEALFGTTETGEQVFRLALGTLERVLDEAIKCYPEQSVNVTWAADGAADVLRVFVAPQREVERVESASASTKSEGPEEDTSAALDTADAESAEQLSKMTLLELRGTNYVDGEAQDHPVTIDAERGPPGSSPPTWQVGFDIVKSTGAEGDAVSREQIASYFADTRSFQRMFSSLALPTGISPADVQAAAERAQEAGVELDEADLSVRFPLGEGIEYRGPSKPVKILRRKAREGEERRKADEKRRLEESGGKERIVEVKSHIEIREV